MGSFETPTKDNDLLWTKASQKYISTILELLRMTWKIPQFIDRFPLDSLIPINHSLCIQSFDLCQKQRAIIASKDVYHVTDGTRTMPLSGSLNDWRISPRVLSHVKHVNFVFTLLPIIFDDNSSCHKYELIFEVYKTCLYSGMQGSSFLNRLDDRIFKASILDQRRLN